MSQHPASDDGRRKQLRQAVERVMIDSSLRSNLSDSQAKRLLDWGTRQLTADFSRSVKLSYDEAGQLMDQQTLFVRRVSHRINELIGWLRSTGEEAKHDIESFRDGMTASGHAESDPYLTQKLHDLLEAWQRLDSDAAFDQLLEDITLLGKIIE
jgi:hypothetical protein